MTEMYLSKLTTLNLTPAQARQFNLPATTLVLRRSWPRSADHLGLEYLAGDGRLIPGQWFREAERLDHVARATAKASARRRVAVVKTGDTRVLLQSNGADRRLAGLAPLLARPGADLVVHRPERRAVVRLQTSAGERYAKVMRPERLPAVVAAGLTVRQLAGNAFATPMLLETDREIGVTIWSALPGTALNNMMSNDRFIFAAGAAGAVLRTLHDLPPPSAIGSHSARDEIGVLQRWFDRLGAFAPGHGRILQAAATRVFKALAEDTSPPVLLHRDFYDKQIIIDARGRVGLLDFDTLTTGEAALDLANALVHFELRVLLERCAIEQAEVAARTMLKCYRPSATVRRRLNVYADAARLRLACVYTFRPSGIPLFPSLLARVGQPVLGSADDVSFSGF